MSEFGEGIEIGPDFVRFSQGDDAFSRADWDPEIAGPKADAFYQGYFMAGAKARAVEGFKRFLACCRCLCRPQER